MNASAEFPKEVNLSNLDSQLVSFAQHASSKNNSAARHDSQPKPRGEASSDVNSATLPHSPVEGQLDAFGPASQNPRLNQQGL